ncbi:MAG: hypothetical protein N2167_03165 [Flavobacteriales bacterium]|nr:hypothetical protein [Flavobacteriales bacterium]
MRRIILNILFVLLGSYSLLACDCGQLLPPLNKAATDSFQVITVARVVKLEPGKNTGVATFEGITLYKGIISSPFQVNYDCITTCKMPFEVGAIWLLYIKKNNTGDFTVHYCERNRKKIPAGEEDEYTIYSQMSWDEEILFLEKNFPKKDFVNASMVNEIDSTGKTVIDASRPLAHASDRQKVFLIVISVLGMLLIYLAIKKWIK